MTRILSDKEIQWAHKMWSLGYTQKRICEALHIGKGTLWRAFIGMPKIIGVPKIKSKLVYKEQV